MEYSQKLVEQIRKRLKKAYKIELTQKEAEEALNNLANLYISFKLPGTET